MGGGVRRYNRYPHNITYPYYSTCISFFAAASLLLCSCLCYFCAIEQTLLKEHSRSFKYRDHANIINYIFKNVHVL